MKEIEDEQGELLDNIKLKSRSVFERCRFT